MYVEYAQYEDQKRGKRKFLFKSRLKKQALPPSSQEYELKPISVLDHLRLTLRGGLAKILL